MAVDTDNDTNVHDVMWHQVHVEPVGNSTSLVAVSEVFQGMVVERPLLEIVAASFKLRKILRAKRATLLFARAQS